MIDYSLLIPFVVAISLQLLYILFKNVFSEYQEEECCCVYLWRYPDPFTFWHNEYDSCFCIDSLHTCTNFKALYRDVPLLKNIVEKQATKYASIEAFSDRNEEKVYTVIKILLDIIPKVKNNKIKIIIILSLYDFVFRNVQYVIYTNPMFAKFLRNKFISMSESFDFKLMLNELEIDHRKWMVILNRLC